MKTWGIADASRIYNIENWGSQYFGINSTGNLTVHPKQGEGPAVDLLSVVQDLKRSGLALPLLIRFQDLIRHRIVALNETFRRVIGEAKYGGGYQGVYPIKVNQMREVVEEILDAGRPYDYGLEAGSKAELAAVVAMELTPKALIICNGYKDQDFIKTALMAKKLGKRVLIVVEKLSDLYQTLAISRELGVQPLFGVRCKLNSKGSGKWEGSGGEFAKFGLTTPELIHVVDILKKEGLINTFKLLHFHVGSQITNIRTIRDAVKEGTRIYAKLQQMGCDLEFLDVGGGLGVDYDGSRTSFESSINYSLAEYVSEVVYTVQEICQAEEVKEPTIVSESGRAVVAHHSVLVVDVFGAIELGRSPLQNDPMQPEPGEHEIVGTMRNILADVTTKNLLEQSHDAFQTKEEALSMFKLGILSLLDRAKVEQLYWQICKVVERRSHDLKYVPEDIENLSKQLADQYLCNFSLFQSMPDHWAIQHLFPIVPIHRHTEEPTSSSILVDVTCDSDGKVCKFVDLRDIKDTLRVHPLRPGEPYYLGFFLMGAYQDIMGDLHNLFGRVHEAHVFLDETEPGGYYIEEVIRGNDIASVLSWIQYSAEYLKKTMKTLIDDRVREGVIKPREGVEFQNFYESVLHGYTYIQPDSQISLLGKSSNEVIQEQKHESPQPRV